MTITAQTDGIMLGSQKELVHYTKAVSGGTLHIMVARNADSSEREVAMVFQGVSGGAGGVSGASKFTAITSGTGTAAAGDHSGANDVVADYSGQAAISITTGTAAQIIADAGLAVGQSYSLLLVNRNSAGLTLLGGTGVTLSGGSAVTPTMTTRRFIMTVTGAAAISAQMVTNGTIT